MEKQVKVASPKSEQKLSPECEKAFKAFLLSPACNGLTLKQALKAAGKHLVSKGLL